MSFLFRILSENNFLTFLRNEYSISYPVNFFTSGMEYTNNKIANLMKELETRKASHGDNHRSVAETLCILGLTYSYVEHDYKKAIYYHRAALQIQATYITNPRTMIDMAITLSDIGNCHMLHGEFLMAKRMILKAKIMMGRSTLNDNHPRIMMFDQSTKSKLDYMNRSNSYVAPFENPMKRCKSSIIDSYSSANRSIPSMNEPRLSASELSLSCFKLKVKKRSMDKES